mmetsp:Transcript_36631/g.79179  ORF Transcript_36631/g.79179 Transcript_36631/m.79179 type:complete len:148 (+) Transcript_36631:80-523(+)
MPGSVSSSVPLLTLLVLVLALFSGSANGGWLNKGKKLLDKVTSNAMPCVPIPGRHCGPDNFKPIAWSIPDKWQCGTVQVSFTDSCKEHDRCYGSCRMSRADCDNAMEDDMRQECKAKLVGPARATCNSKVEIYMAAVRAGGSIGYKC